jgi:hypothetical protein
MARPGRLPTVAVVSELYTVRISFDAPEGGQAIADRLLEAFGSWDTVTAARPTAVSAESGEVTVRFDEVPADLPPHGAKYDPPREDEPSEEPGRAAIELAAELPADVVVPALRALITLTGAGSRVGLPPRQTIRLEVEPAAVHRQDELRHS